MITLEDAKELKPGDYLVDEINGKRWKVNGKVQTWKTDPSRIRIPLKHGLYSYAALITEDFNDDGTCDLVSKERETM
jgi:hypothetical protein